MDLISIGIGVVVGIVFGALAVWVLDRKHQRTVENLVESRRKIERQRTQAVNDLFAFKADAGVRSRSAEPQYEDAKYQELTDELENLRMLVTRADAALASARSYRDAQDAEIADLKARVQYLRGVESGNVVDIRRTATDHGYAGYGQA